MRGSFTEKVFNIVKQIPEGRVSAYSDIACALSRGSARAVGSALRRSPGMPEVPCHRVVLKSGRLGGFSGPGGVPGKKLLLEREGVRVYSGRVAEFEQIRWKPAP